ncbi:hypothetical protein Tco_1087809 [Tanacetum coccineum]
MLDYGFNFMNTKIYIDNESTICIVKNPVFHSKTKHIKIRHHFIRDAYEKKLIQVLKIHTDDNVADLLTKAFDMNLSIAALVEERHGAECIYYRIFRSNESSRWIKTFSEMVTMFDRLDIEELYNLVMQRFESTTPEGVDLVLWGDLRTMFDVNTEDELWQNQERWNLKSWNFYTNCRVHILTLEDGNEIHMLAERKYLLTKETLERMMSLKLIAESTSESAYNLLRFIQKHIDEYGSNDGSEKDL